MSQVMTPRVEKGFFLSQLTETVGSAIQGQLGKMELKTRALVKTLSVNNYLKSPEEIEDDFRVAKRLTLAPDKIRNNKDGYLNIRNPERIDSGFMEENY